MAAPAIPSSPERVATGAILTYSAPTAGFGFMFILINVYLLKYATDELRVPATTIGLIFGASRIWDAVSDPLIGFLSDRTRTRLGRRRPWLLAGALPVAAAFAMIWSPPRALEGVALQVWLAVAIVGFYTAMTAVDVPHASLGAELSRDYHQRTRVFGLRRLTFGVGAFCALAGVGASRDVAAPLALVAAAASAALIAFAGMRVRERPEHQGRGTDSPWRAVGDVWRNPHARLLLTLFLLQQIGVAMLGVMFPFFSEYVVGTPEYTSRYLLAFFVASFASVPVWMRLARRFQKKPLLISAMAASGAAIGAIAFAGPGDAYFILAVAAVGGFGAGGSDVVAPSIQADVIDYDEYRTGERKEGAYFATWAFVIKSAGGLALLVAGPALDASGFTPHAAQPELARWAMRALVGGVPAVLYACGLLVFLRFGLDRPEHARIRAAIDERGASHQSLSR